MSRLVNFGLGEIADRLTILGLKVAYGTEQGADVEHFRNERNALLVKIRAAGAGDGRWMESLLELAAVNARIWQGEDELRWYRFELEHAYGPKDLEEIRLLAFKLQALNDRRAELIADINASVGEVVREKLPT